MKIIKLPKKIENDYSWRDYLAKERTKYIGSTLIYHKFYMDLWNDVNEKDDIYLEDSKGSRYKVTQVSYKPQDVAYNNAGFMKLLQRIFPMYVRLEVEQVS